MHILTIFNPRAKDFTRLKLVQGKKEEVEAAEKENVTTKMENLKITENDEDITAQFDAQDDEDVVF